MDFFGLLFPGIPDVELGRSQRSYSYDPVGSLSIQSAQAPQGIGLQADNITRWTPWGSFSPNLRLANSQANLVQTKPYHRTDPGWWSFGWTNDWNDLRRAGVGYGLYAPHLPMQPVPVHKLYEPGSGFILPATFLGQPLAANVRPPGT